MPTRKWVRCEVCNHIYQTGSPNPTCSSCKNKRSVELTEDEIKQAVNDGKITPKHIPKSLQDTLHGLTGGQDEKRVIGASKGLTLDPQVQSLFEYETKFGKGKMPLSDFMNDSVKNYYRDVKGIEPAIMIGGTSGIQTPLSMGGAKKELSSSDMMKQQMDEIRLQKLSKLQFRELENMTREDELELKEKELAMLRKSRGDTPSEHKSEDASFDMEKMMSMDLKSQAFRQMLEERQLQNEMLRLRNEKAMAEIENIKSGVQRGKMSGDGQWLDGGMGGNQPPWWLTLILSNNNKQQSNSSTPEQLALMLDQRLEKFKNEQGLLSLQRESLEREQRFMSELQKVNEQKQNMVLNEVLRRQHESEQRQGAPDRLDLLHQLKDEIPWIFGNGGKEAFNPEKKKMDIEEKLVDKGLNVADKFADRLGRGADRAGGMFEKVVDSSLRRAEKQEYETYSDEDLEKMYERVSHGDEQPFGSMTDSAKPQAVTYKTLQEQGPEEEEAPQEQAAYNPEDFFSDSGVEKLNEGVQAEFPEEPKPQQERKKIKGGLTGEF